MFTKIELSDIKALQEACEREGGFHLKLNFEMLESRAQNQNDDYLHYEEGKLVGFLGCYYFGSKVELCGMVHPDYRRKGIFSNLLEKGLAEAKRRAAQEILLNAPTSSLTAKEFLKTIPCEFSVAEYQMQWHDTTLLDDSSITIRPSVSEADLESEIQLDVLGFDEDEASAREFSQIIRESSQDQRMLIEANGRVAGKIRVSESDGEAWIYGFTVYPELRGKGIGRKALSKVVAMEQKKGLPVFLEVEARNAHALGLYESCGFRSYHSQDYYKYLG
ncbi:GNAT family N-acetyltransferase [Neobacillus sp. Marseille-QA0830]